MRKTTGKKRTEEQKAKMSQSQKGKVLSERHKNLLRGSRPHVIAHNRDHTVYTFQHKSGLTETCTRQQLVEKYNLNNSNLSVVLRGIRRSHGGWSVIL